MFAIAQAPRYVNAVSGLCPVSTPFFTGAGVSRKAPVFPAGAHNLLNPQIKGDPGMGTAPVRAFMVESF